MFRNSVFSTQLNLSRYLSTTKSQLHSCNFFHHQIRIIFFDVWFSFSFLLLISVTIFIHNLLFFCKHKIKLNYVFSSLFENHLYSSITFPSFISPLFLYNNLMVHNSQTTSISNEFGVGVIESNKKFINLWFVLSYNVFR